MSSHSKRADAKAAVNDTRDFRDSNDDTTLSPMSPPITQPYTYMKKDRLLKQVNPQSSLAEKRDQDVRAVMKKRKTSNK